MPEEQSASQRWLIITLCFFVTVLEGYDLQAIGVAIPIMAPALGLSKEEIGIAVSATMAGLMLGAFLGGACADHLGRRPVLTAGVLIFALATLATLFAHDVITLATARGVTGLGVGMVMPNVIAISTDITEKRDRAKVGALMMCGFPVGALIAAALVAVHDTISWQEIFILGGITPLILAPIMWFFMPETSPVKKETNAPKIHLLSALFGEGRAFMTVNIWLCTAIALLVVYLFLNWLPTLVAEKGFDKSIGAAAAFWFNVGSIIGVLALGRIVDAMGFRVPLAAAYILLLLGFILFAQTATPSVMYVVAALCGACIIGAQTALYAITPSFYPESARGIGGGAALAAGRLGAIVGPLTVGYLLQGGKSADDVIVSIMPLLAIALISVVILSYSKQSVWR